jgi:hypothetical protein
MELSTIQKREKLNTVERNGEEGPGGAYHEYEVVMLTNAGHETSTRIMFQKGPRKDPDSQYGVLDPDLLEIVRDRLISFQAGPFASRYNAVALTHVEEALMWLNRRVEDRIERNVLGTNEK